jgi:3-hydroxyisobutyrate dehydrogenase-like beta-hydroxyacid dehydrogenase
VFFGRDGIASCARRGTVVIETSTMPLETKMALREGCAPHGITVLDCPISGTGAQAAAKDISVYASGERDAVRQRATSLPVLAQHAFLQLSEMATSSNS